MKMNNWHPLTNNITLLSHSLRCKISCFTLMSANMKWHPYRHRKISTLRHLHEGSLMAVKMGLLLTITRWLYQGLIFLPVKLTHVKNFPWYLFDCGLDSKFLTQDSRQTCLFTCMVVSVNGLNDIWKYGFNVIWNVGSVSPVRNMSFFFC